MTIAVRSVGASEGSSLRSAFWVVCWHHKQSGRCAHELERDAALKQALDPTMLTATDRDESPSARRIAAAQQDGER